jgi:hypothetical protein
VEGPRGLWRALEGSVRLWKALEGPGRPWKALEGPGRPWKALEGPEGPRRSWKVVKTLEALVGYNSPSETERTGKALKALECRSKAKARILYEQGRGKNYRIIME